MSKKVRTRYAPSPTGYLHIGGARTALFSYLFAKHFDGDFILRIEDTDIERNVENGEESQIDNLEWLGIKIDESPRNPIEKYGKYRQSEKLDRYNEVIDSLIEKGYAYKAYDTPEELTKQRELQAAKGIFSFRYDRNALNISDKEKAKRDSEGKYSIRLALPENTEYSWNDIVRGKISVNTSDIGDFVIRKQNGYPTYNFAVVIDDHDMEITHVLRGEEHTTNTPKQLAIYDVLGWKPPEFGHLTIITNMEGKKLSKRDDSIKQFIEDYKDEGYSSEGIFNFLALLGWTHPEAKEILSQEELIKSFDPNRLSKSPSKFDIKKMEWFSKEYIKSFDNNKIAMNLLILKGLENSSNALEELANSENVSVDWITLFIDTYKQSSITYSSLLDNLKIYSDKSVTQKDKEEVVIEFANQLAKVEFSPEGIQEAINKTKEVTGLNGKKLFMPIRLATTYQEHGPELAKAIYLFGKELIKERLK